MFATLAASVPRKVPVLTKTGDHTPGLWLDAAIGLPCIYGRRCWAHLAHPSPAAALQQLMLMCLPRL